MIRLALISLTGSVVDQQIAELQEACARLRHVELAATAASDDEVQRIPRAQFDAAVLRAPVARHAELTSQFAKAGKHVLLFGPMAQTIEDANRLIDDCRTANIRLMLGGTIRFQPSINSIKVALDSKQLGIPALLRSHSWSAAEQNFDAEAETKIFQQLDLAGWIFNGLPTEIYANAHHDWRDALQLHFGFPENGMGLITINQSLPPGDRYRSCSVIGSTGAAYADDHRQMQLLYQRNTSRAIRTTEGIGTLVEELREFAAAITQNREPSVSGADGLRALLLTDAVRHSIELRQPLKREGDRYVPID